MSVQDDGSQDTDHTERGYEAQSEDEGADGSTLRRHKRFTVRSRQPEDMTSSMPGSSSQSSSGNVPVERSESGHALFYDPVLKGWRRDEAGVRKRHKSTGPLPPEELTPSVTNLHRTHSGTPVVYDRWRGYWRRERRHKTVNFSKLTPEQQDAKRTASGTDIYYDERRMEWRRWRTHLSDVPTPTKSQQFLKRTGSGSAIVYDNTREVWKRKQKRMGPLSPEQLLEAQRQAEAGWDCELVQDKGYWYLEKQRRHLQDGELSKKQLKAQRTSSGTPITFDSEYRRWKRVYEQEGASTSGADHSDFSSRSHRHHHGFKRISYLYTKDRKTGKWTKKKLSEPDVFTKRLRTPDGGYIFFDDERLCWRKAKTAVEGNQQEKLSFFGRVREYFFGEDDDDEEQAGARATGRRPQPGSAQFSVRQQQLQLTPAGSEPRRQNRTSYRRPGLWGKIKNFFAAICRFLRIC